MSWYYQNEIVESIPEEILGFVYCITNNITGRKYIGKKLAKFSKTTTKTVRVKVAFLGKNVIPSKKTTKSVYAQATEFIRTNKNLDAMKTAAEANTTVEYTASNPIAANAYRPYAGSCYAVFTYCLYLFLYDLPCWSGALLDSQ